MKVFFIGERRFEPNIKLNKAIIKTLKDLQYSVDTSLIETKHEADLNQFSEAYKRNLLSIKSCDFIVAEVTSTSSGLGFLLATAINFKKPVVALFNKEIAKNTPLTLQGVNSKLFDFNPYTEENLKQVLTKSLTKIKQNLDTKFILIIPAEIDRYLEWASDYKRMHKAQLVRQAIEDYMERDADWKEFMSEE